MLERRHNSIVDFEITIPELLLRQEQRTKTIFNIVLGAIASISLVVGGIGIMNIMLASVLERIREIGVRRAMGATQKDILFQFLSEAVIISVAGGIAGIIVGTGLSSAIEHLAGIHTLVSYISVFVAFAVSLSVGLVLRHRARMARRATGPRRLSSLRVSHMSRLASHAHRLARPLILALLTSVAPLGAQEPLTLQHAVEMAQQQGLQAQAALSARDAARARDRAFGARLLPQLSLSGSVPSYNRSIIPVLQPDGSTIFRPQQQTDASLNLNLSQRLPLTGGNLTISSSLAQLRVTGDQDRRTWSSTPFSIGLTQQILRPNTLAWDRRAQDLQSDEAEQQYLEAREDVAIQTTEAFFDFYAAQMALNNAITNAAVNDTLYRLNQGRFEVGKIGENDLLQSELALLRARTSVDGARLDYERTLAALRLAINVAPDFPITIATPSDIPTFDADTAVAVAQALRHRSQVIDLDLQDVQARRRIAEAKLNNNVGATIIASYGYNATAPEMNLAYQNLLEAQKVSVALSMPLFQWGAHGADVQAAQADRQRITSNNKATREQISQEAHFAALQLAQSRRQLELSAKADTVASKRFEVAYNRYHVAGRITIDNLYLAQNEKDQALLQYVQSLRGYWSAYYRLRRLTLYDFETGREIR